MNLLIRSLALRSLKLAPQRLVKGACLAQDSNWKLKAGFVNMEASLGNLAANGFVPGGVIDIGAYHGEWTRMAAKIFPNAKFFMFEAQPDKRAILDEVAATLNGRAKVTIGLLGPEARDAEKFHLLHTGSSVFAETTNFEKDVVSLPMHPLDTLLKDEPLPEPLLLKLDVQGYELQVLEGASSVLARAEVVLMEVALLEFNAGAPLAGEVIEYMARKDFVVYDICGLQRRESDLAALQCDLIFTRRDSALRQRKKVWSYEPDSPRGA